MPRKPRQVDYRPQLVALLESLGAQPSTVGVGVFGFAYDYRIETPVGWLNLSPYGNWLAGRFDEPARAIAAGFTCNPYSGKYNFHHFDTAPDTLVEYCRRGLADIMASDSYAA